MLRNLGELDFDLSRSLKVKSDSVIGLAIYGFLLMVNSNIGPNLGLNYYYYCIKDIVYSCTRVYQQLRS